MVGRFSVGVDSRLLTYNTGERALEQLNYSLIKGRAW